jgi:hypothetical protein
MKYLSLSVLLVAGLSLVGCQGRGDRTRATAWPDGSISVDAGLGDAGGGDAFVEDATVATDGAIDGDVIVDAGPHDTTRPPADSSVPTDTGVARPDTGPATCAPTAASVAIVEVMIASQSGADNGEWFEVVNTGGCTVDLSGLEIGSPTTDGAPVTHRVSTGTIAPGGSFVFALSGDPVENHGLMWDYVYGSGTRSDVFFGNAGDVLTIAYGGAELDRVEWSTEHVVRGASLQYPRGASIAGNSDIGRWCDSVRVYSTTGGTFYGSPGLANDPC